MSLDQTPEDAEEFRFYCACGCGRMGFELEGVAYFVAAELERLADDADERRQEYSPRELRLRAADLRADAVSTAGSCACPGEVG